MINRIIIDDIQFKAILNNNKKQIRITTDDESTFPYELTDNLQVLNRNHLNTLQIKINKYRKEKLQKITAEDALAEGVIKLDNLYKDYIDSDKYGTDYGCLSPVLSFRTLWQLLYGTNIWQNNPLVWVVEFELLE